MSDFEDMAREARQREKEARDHMWLYIVGTVGGFVVGWIVGVALTDTERCEDICAEFSGDRIAECRLWCHHGSGKGD